MRLAGKELSNRQWMAIAFLIFQSGMLVLGFFGPFRSRDGLLPTVAVVYGRLSGATTSFGFFTPQNGYFGQDIKILIKNLDNDNSREVRLVDALAGSSWVALLNIENFLALPLSYSNSQNQISRAIAKWALWVNKDWKSISISILIDSRNAKDSDQERKWVQVFEGNYERR